MYGVRAAGVEGFTEAEGLVTARFGGLCGALDGTDVFGFAGVTDFVCGLTAAGTGFFTVEVLVVLPCDLTGAGTGFLAGREVTGFDIAAMNVRKV